MIVDNSNEGAKEMTHAQDASKDLPTTTVPDTEDLARGGSGILSRSDGANREVVDTPENNDQVPKEAAKDADLSGTQVRMLRAADYASIRDQNGELWLVPVADHPTFSSATDTPKTQEQITREQYTRGDAILKGTMPASDVTEKDLVFLESQVTVLDCQMEKRQRMKDRIGAVIKAFREQG
jgi:hypothetical protein